MINDLIKKLQLKISDLENEVEKIKKNSINKINELGFSMYSKKLINFKVLSSRRFKIASIKNHQKNNLFFQAKVSFYNYSSQEIGLSLYSNNIKIGTNTQLFGNDLCEISVNGTYQDLTSDEINIYLNLNPKSKKLISIISAHLTVWGDNNSNNLEYEAVETSNNYFLCYITNNQLFYKLIDKNQVDNEFEFELKGEYLSHSICKTNSDELYLFKIDLNQNLIFENLQNSQELFISNNAQKVSCCYFDNQICFSYLSNGECYYGEIFNNAVISNKKLTSLFGKFSNCYLYSNNNLNKCYLILTKIDGSNYLLENISSNFSSSENICVEIELTISTGEGE